MLSSQGLLSGSPIDLPGAPKRRRRQESSLIACPWSFFIQTQLVRSSSRVPMRRPPHHRIASLVCSRPLPKVNQFPRTACPPELPFAQPGGPQASIIEVFTGFFSLAGFSQLTNSPLFAATQRTNWASLKTPTPFYSLVHVYEQVSRSQ
jgi:hypothetical protein